MSKTKDLSIAAISIVVLAALVATVASFFAGRGDARPDKPAQGCQVSVEEHSAYLDYDQAQNAAIIVGESIRRGLPARAATIALTTAMQESMLRNLDYGDLDSIGLFQQRPSQGWGTQEQIMDPWYSAGAFYDHLVTVPDWQNGDINDVAQEVQRSNHPNEYRKHEPDARAWASALAGFSPAAISCVDQQENPADPTKLTDFFTRVWADALLVAQDGSTITVQAGSKSTTWAVAQLSQMLGQQAGLVAASTNDHHWTMSPDSYQQWQSSETPSPEESSWRATLLLRSAEAN